jgi:hypothetical protein
LPVLRAGAAFKDALGYNTLLPDAYAHAPIDGYHQHCHSPDELKSYVGKLSEAEKKSFKVMSFGDEIALGEIAWADPAMQTKFTAWLKARGITAEDLGGLAPEAAKLADRSANWARRVTMSAQWSWPVLSEEQIARIREAAVTHIERHGFVVQDGELLAKAKARGAQVDEARGRVRLPRALLAELMATLPSRYTVRNILGETWEIGTVQLGRAENMPTWAECGGAMTHRYDPQCGAEGMLFMLAAHASGADIISGFGSCHNAMGMSAEMMVIHPAESASFRSTAGRRRTAA